MILRGRPKKVLPKIVLGILGLPGFGVEQVSSYLETRYKFTIVSVNKLIKKEIIEGNLKDIDYEQTDFFHDRILKYFPDTYFVEKVLKNIYKSGRPGNVINNLYSENEIKYLKKYDFFYTVEIHAGQDKRWQRFQHTHKREIKIEEFTNLERRISEYSGKSKIDFMQLLNKCDYKIYNNGSLGELYEGIERVLRSLKKRDKEIGEILLSRQKIYTSKK